MSFEAMMWRIWAFIAFVLIVLVPLVKWTIGIIEYHNNKKARSHNSGPNYNNTNSKIEEYYET